MAPFDYGFVHFQSAKDAKKALNEADSDQAPEYEGKKLTVRVRTCAISIT